MTTDPRIAALAEAMTVWQGNRYEYAAAILAALDGWTLISDEDMIDGWKARDEERAAEIARLRKIEEAAQAVLAADALAESGQVGADRRWDEALDALRAALEAER